MVTRQGLLGGAFGLWMGSMVIAPPAHAMPLPSCVAGSPPLIVGDGAAYTLLDAGDRRRLDEAAQALYALYRRGGDAVSDVMLLQRGAAWLYVTLAPREPGGRCFTAVFAADRFDFTDRWLHKYLPQAAAEDD